MCSPIGLRDGEVDGAFSQLRPLEVVQALEVRVQVAEVLRGDCARRSVCDEVDQRQQGMARTFSLVLAQIALPPAPTTRPRAPRVHIRATAATTRGAGWPAVHDGDRVLETIERGEGLDDGGDGDLTGVCEVGSAGDIPCRETDEARAGIPCARTWRLAYTTIGWRWRTLVKRSAVGGGKRDVAPRQRHVCRAIPQLSVGVGGLDGRRDLLGVDARAQACNLG